MVATDASSPQTSTADSVHAALPAELLLSAIIDSSDDAIVSKSLDGTITSWNRGAERIFGYTAAEIVGQSVLTLIPPELHHEEAEILARLQRGERIEHFESIRMRKDGGRFPVSLTISPVKTPDGRIIGASKVARDLTGHRKHLELRNLHAAIVESSDDAIVSKDLNGIITSWNSGAKRIFGYEAGEIVGRSVLTLIPPELHGDEPMILSRLRRGERIDHFETTRVRKDGRRVHVSLTISPIRDGSGVLVGASKVARDITLQREAEAALRESRIKLEKHAQELEQHVAERTAKLQETVAELEAFSYSVSHDMRTPLRSIVGYAERLLRVYRGKLDAEGVHHLERISKNAERLELLVRDVLAYSKVAKSEIRLLPVDLGPFLETILATLPEAQQEAALITVQHPLPRVLGHEAYLLQVFTNLVDNALKFAAEGRKPAIEIRGTSDGGWATISVCDNGIGIAPEHFDRIFEIFGRVYPDKKFEGTGIGLSIVRKAVQRMGGTVLVASTLGQGSCFSFTLQTA